MGEQLATDMEMATLIGAVDSRSEGDDAVVSDMIRHYPNDPRLHFMLGSIMASKGRAIAARLSMSRAVELAPDFLVARYQLGFLELTSGEPMLALSTWGALLAAPRDNYLRVFVEGMTHLIRNEFAEAIQCFKAGIALNHNNLPMNNDIQLLIHECNKQLMVRGPQSRQHGNVQSAVEAATGQMKGIGTESW